MEYFNIRYECNDAKDDYSAQLKKGEATGGLFPSWMSSEEIDHVEDINEQGQGDDFGDDDGIDDEDYGVNKYTTMGPKGRLIKAQMDATENSVKNAGWLDSSPDGLAKINISPIQPEVTQPGSKWKITVQDKRQEIITERNTHLSTTTANSRSHSTNVTENEVKIVDQSYLRHDFKAKDKAT